MSMDQPVEALLYPYVTAPARIALDVVDALAACPAVSRVVLFGSLAEDTHDGWSDVDALCVVEGEDGAWQAAAALRQTLPLRWHGASSTGRYPSGRHWLLGESVFHSLDLSFGTAAEVGHYLAGAPAGRPPVGDVRLDRAGVPSAGRPPLEVASKEYDFTHTLHAALQAMKAYLRARGNWDALAERMQRLEEAYRGLAAPPPGSEPDALTQETRTLYYALMQERMRYGGDG